MPHVPAVDLRSRESIGDQDVLAGKGLLPDTPVASLEEAEGLLKIRRQHRDARRSNPPIQREARSRQVVRLTKCYEKLQLTPPICGVLGPERAMSLELDKFRASRRVGGALLRWSGPVAHVQSLALNQHFPRATSVSAKNIRRRTVSILTGGG